VVNIEKGDIQPLWCGVQAPVDATSREISTTVTVTAVGEAATRVPFRLAITPEIVRNAGDDEPTRLSRLRWIDSTLAVDDGIVPPYTPDSGALLLNANSVTLDLSCRFSSLSFGPKARS
jgi:Family of unknown function (DUF6067)